MPDVMRKTPNFEYMSDFSSRSKFARKRVKMGELYVSAVTMCDLCPCMR